LKVLSAGGILTHSLPFLPKVAGLVALLLSAGGILTHSLPFLPKVAGLVALLLDGVVGVAAGALALATLRSATAIRFMRIKGL